MSPNSSWMSPKLENKIQKTFLKTQEVFFEKNGLSLAREYIVIFNS